MKQWIAVLLAVVMALSVSACAARQAKEITCQDVVDAYSRYEEYVVYHKHVSDEESRICYVQVNEADGDYVYFEFYDTAQHAKENKGNYNAIVWLLGVLYGETRWLHTDTYQNIRYEYLDRDLIKPFRELIRA